MPRNRKLRQLINHATWGVVNTLTGLVLYQLAFGAALLTASGGKSSRAASAVLGDADTLSDRLFASFDPAKLRNAVWLLKRKGLITAVRGKWDEVQITKQGLHALKTELPTYREKRPWDKRIYLVTYDVLEKDHRGRKELYRFLHRIGCAPIQKSTFLSVYSPKGLLASWRKDHPLLGDILVSDLGPDGSLGDRPFQDIIVDAYLLISINNRYGEFLKEVSRSAKENSKRLVKVMPWYHSILKDDPQLPFELLPDWWLGDDAYERVRQIAKLGVVSPSGA